MTLSSSAMRCQGFYASPSKLGLQLFTPAVGQQYPCEQRCSMRHIRKSLQMHTLFHTFVLGYAEVVRHTRGERRICTVLQKFNTRDRTGGFVGYCSTYEFFLFSLYRFPQRVRYLIGHKVKAFSTEPSTPRLQNAATLLSFSYNTSNKRVDPSTLSLTLALLQKHKLAILAVRTCQCATPSSGGCTLRSPRSNFHTKSAPHVQPAHAGRVRNLLSTSPRFEHVSRTTSHS